MINQTFDLALANRERLEQARTGMDYGNFGAIWLREPFAITPSHHLGKAA